MIYSTTHPPMLTCPAEVWAILLLPHAGIILRVTACPTCGGVVLRQASLSVCETCGILEEETK
jgi:hypothetical protein